MVNNNNIRDAWRRRIISSALVICGKKPIVSLQDDRDDVAIAKSEVDIVIDLALRMGYFTLGVQETILTPVPEPDRQTSSGVPYYLPTDFIGVRDVRIKKKLPEPSPFYGTSHHCNSLAYPQNFNWFLEGNFLILPDVIENVALLYIGSSNLRNDPLFLDYAIHSLAIRIVSSISNREQIPSVNLAYERCLEKVASLSADDSSQNTGSPLFGSIFYR